MRPTVRILVVLALFATMVGATSQPVSAGGTFIDDDGSVFEADIEWLAAEGITKGCNPPTNDRFCPDANMTRGQMAAFLVRAFGYTDDGGGNLFVDDDDSIFEADIDRLGTAGVTKGCNPPTNDRFCPEANVTRGQMAAFLVRAFGYTDDGGGNLFVDDDTSIFEADIDRLGTAGVTKGCNPPTNDKYCPDAYVTRGQMAAFLHRAFTATPVPDPLVITTMSLPDGDVGDPYTATLAATGGVAPYTWAVTAGILPTGLTLNLDGTITGTPTADGSTSFTVQSKDSASVTATKALGLVINPAPLVITTSSLPDGDVGTPYNTALTATGGVTPHTWTITTGTLPAGLTLNPDGTITGTPTTRGSGSFTIQARDAVTVTATTNLDLVINPAPLVITTTSFPDGDVGTPYSATLVATGGVTPYTWTITTGTLPAGLTLNPNGTITGTPTTFESPAFTVQAVDSLAVIATKNLTINVAIADPICVQSYIPQIECVALVDLYNSTTGLSWEVDFAWFDDPDPCGWYGISCHLGHVISINLAADNLDGTIPSSLGHLTALRGLYLNHNLALMGPIPSQLGNLNALEYLDFRYCGLTGPIPSQLGNLNTLKNLDLRHNGLTGPIPAELGNLAALERMDLWHNALTGPIPAELGKLAALEYLGLGDNGLTGPIPTKLDYLSALEHLDLRNNALTGPIPAELGNLAALRYLYLSDNALTESIPAELGNFTVLADLYLNNNALTGPIPAELGKLVALKHLYLGNNGLTGPIPAKFGNLSALEHLYLNDNDLFGPVLDELRTDTSIEFLQLRGQTGCLTAKTPEPTNWLLGLDSDWDDGCP